MHPSGRYGILADIQADYRALTAVLDYLSRSAAEYLKRLPQRLTVDNAFILVHGSLVERDGFILTPVEMSQNLECMRKESKSGRICFFGRTRIPILIGTKAVITDLSETKSFQLSREDLYLINPGSVGRTGHSSPSTSFGIFDAADWSMTFVRLPFDTMPQR